jgi:hypothetical protein
VVPARLTVAARWGPGVTLRCGTRMARPVRLPWETCLVARPHPGDWRMRHLVACIRLVLSMGAWTSS